MNLQFRDGKWSVDPTFNFEVLKKQAPLVAVLAQFDLEERIVDTGKFTIVNGSLYCYREDRSSNVLDWWYFEPETRRWKESNNPK